MSEHTFAVTMERFGRVAADLEEITKAADREVWRAASRLERTYGGVTVRAEWERNGATVTVSGEIDARDVPAYVELYFHDLFLLINIAVPGAFSGRITGAGEYRMNELRLDARTFEYAWVSAARRGWPSIDVLPLDDVVAWYDALGIGTRQIARTRVEEALFHLLHLARRDEADAPTVRRALEALRNGDVESLRATPPVGRLFEAAPVHHPMHDDQLDEDVDDDLSEAVDVAAGVIVSTLQAHAANH